MSFSLHRALYFFAAVFLFGCQNLEEHHKKIRLQDAAIKKSREQFRALNQSPCPPMPRAKSGILYPKKVWPSCFQKKVSLTLSGNIPLQEAFYELAKQTQMNVILNVTRQAKNAVFYQALNQPLGQVIENLCAMGNLRYLFENNTLYISADTPYMRTHNIQFLLGSRKTHTQTSVKTDIFASGLQNTSKNLTDNGASIVMNTAHSVDFWEELEKNIGMILSVDAKKVGQYSLNKYAGILTVHGTDKQQKQIAAYLAHLKRLVTTQILIEAKIIEIDLSNEYRSGVDWSAFLKKGAAQLIPSTAIAQPLLSGIQGQYSFRVSTDYLNLLVTHMEKFGTVRTLANPRQTVVNNQAAVLKVAHNAVFFELQIQDDGCEFERNAYVTRQRAQSRIQTVPIGLILYVHPSLNVETGEIIVSLHPTISRVVGTKSDPAVALYAKDHNIESQIPIVQVREMDSVIVAKEGQVIVTGGLMEERVSNVTSDVPVISDIPIIGQLFQSQKKETQLTELVILLTLSVVGDSHNMQPADQRLYYDYTQDPRPLPAH